MKKRIIILMGLIIAAISTFLIYNHLKSSNEDSQIAANKESHLEKDIEKLTREDGLKFAYTYKGAQTSQDFSVFTAGLGTTYVASLSCTNGTVGTIEDGHIKITSFNIPSECSIDFDDVSDFMVTLAAANSSEGTQQKTFHINTSDTFTVTPSSGYTLTNATVSCPQATASINTSTGVVTISDVTQVQTCSVTLLPTYTITMNVSGGTSNPASKSIVSGGTDTFTVTPNSNYTLTGATVSCSQATASIDESTGVVTVSNVSQAQTCTVTLPTTVTPGQSYTIAFNVNGGNTWTITTCTSGGGTYVARTCRKTVVTGSTYGSLPTPIKPLYTFDGWYTASSGGDLITDASIVAITKNTTLYAHWSDSSSGTYTITYSGFSSTGSWPTSIDSGSSTNVSVAASNCSSNLSCDNAACSYTNLGSGLNASMYLTISNPTGNVTVYCGGSSI